MARQLRIEFPGAFYHVTSRGNERKAIFKSQLDREKFLGNKKHDRNLPNFRALSNRPDMEQIIETVDSVFGSNDKLSRQVKLYLCHRYSGRKLKEIGAYFDPPEADKPSKGGQGFNPPEAYKFPAPWGVKIISD